MGYNCRCKNCGTDFIDMYGEFCVGDNYDELECPICDSHDIILYEDIPGYPDSFHPIYYDDNIDKLRNEYNKKKYDNGNECKA